MAFLGRGYAFPLRPVSVNGGPGAGLAWRDNEDQVAQSIWLILSTSPGERVMRPTFGCGIHDYVFEANSPSLRDEISTRVLEALTRFEPRIDVQSVEVQPNEDAPAHLSIEITYTIPTSNRYHNLVFPFFLQEVAG